MVRLRLAVAALIALGGLAACDGEPEPKMSDPTPSATTESHSPTATASSALNAEDTVHAWVSARNQALQNGDTTAAEALGSVSCTTCEDSLKPIRDVYAAGGHYETTGWTVEAAEVVKQTATKATVSAGIEYAAGTTFPTADSEPVSYDVEKHVVLFRLALTDGTWLVDFIGYVS